MTFLSKITDKSEMSLAIAAFLPLFLSSLSPSRGNSLLALTLIIFCSSIIYLIFPLSSFASFAYPPNIIFDNSSNAIKIFMIDEIVLVSIEFSCIL